MITLPPRTRVSKAVPTVKFDAKLEPKLHCQEVSLCEKLTDGQRMHVPKATAAVRKGIAVQRREGAPRRSNPGR